MRSILTIAIGTLVGSLLGFGVLKEPTPKLSRPCFSSLNLSAIEEKARRYGSMNELAFAVQECESTHPGDPDCAAARMMLCSSLQTVDAEPIDGFVAIPDARLTELRQVCGLNIEEH